MPDRKPSQLRSPMRTSGPAPLRPADEPAPFDLHLQAAMGAVTYSRRLTEGGCLRFPWRDIHELVGDIMPGWLVLWGARAKGGKSTALRAVFNQWVTLGHRVVYVGTEQRAAVLKLLWACERLQFPGSVAFDVHDPRHELVLRDVTEAQGDLADRGILVADPGLTLAGFIEWARYAFKVKARALILDHFHRLECEAGEQQGQAIRDIKNAAEKSGMVILAAAQLKQGEGGPLGEYEVPGPHSWSGTAGLQRECDVALQSWRPFKPNIERGQKQAAKDDPEKLAEIIQPNVMAVRVAAHRYEHRQDEATGHRAARLFVRDGLLYGWGQR